MLRSWIVEYRPKCGCTALKEPVDCGQGFKVYADSTLNIADEIDRLRARIKSLEERCNDLKEIHDSKLSRAEKGYL